MANCYLSCRLDTAGIFFKSYLRLKFAKCSCSCTSRRSQPLIVRSHGILHLQCLWPGDQESTCWEALPHPVQELWRSVLYGLRQRLLVSFLVHDNFQKTFSNNTVSQVTHTAVLHCSYTVEPRYNKDIGTMKITLFRQVLISVKNKQIYVESWDQQNYLVIRGFCYSDLLITRFHCGPLWTNVDSVTFLITFQRRTQFWTDPNRNDNGLSWPG